MVKAETGYLEAFAPNRGATSPANVGIFIAALGPNQTEVRFDERLHRWINVYPNGWRGAISATDRVEYSTLV